MGEKGVGHFVERGRSEVSVRTENSGVQRSSRFKVNIFVRNGLYIH